MSLPNEHRVKMTCVSCKPAHARIKKLEKALREVKECFDAAYAEGLPEAMNETKDEKLKGILDRRLLYALAPVIEVLNIE